MHSRRPGSWSKTAWQEAVAVKHPDTIWTTPAPKQWKTVPMQFAVLHCVVPLIVCTFHVTIRESPAGNRQASMAQVLL